MVRKTKYRMSGCVVFIGYILLIPSVLGMLVGGLALAGVFGAASQMPQAIRDEVSKELRAASVPESIVAQVQEGKTVPESELEGLPPEQREAVKKAEMDASASMAGAGVGAVLAGGMAIFVFVSSLVGGLLGWLLVMKKKILQCTNCGAVVAAS